LYTLELCRPIPLEASRGELWQALRKEVFAIFTRSD
jgi:hypothetical protein